MVERVRSLFARSVHRGKSVERRGWRRQRRLVGQVLSVRARLASGAKWGRLRGAREVHVRCCCGSLRERNDECSKRDHFSDPDL
eukprot:scaffold38728_cov56-Phaeocystis_antarctica.AAC.6